ncbi:hypothetical protein BV133_1616 [Blastochloris viridis]|uniref:Uncharacterized protein n=1 Tax=Blastochloris viridis TaxID=1079 RepID=A0A182D197_BLAVI|nr:hypothetical protein BV133_1616 [Blastochloris viridis]
MRLIRFPADQVGEPYSDRRKTLIRKGVFGELVSGSPKGSSGNRIACSCRGSWVPFPRAADAALAGDDRRWFHRQVFWPSFPAAPTTPSMRRPRRASRSDARKGDP